MTIPRSTLATLAAVALAAGIAAPAMATESAEEPIPVDAIEGITWQLQEQAVDGDLTALPDGVIVTLVLAAGQAGGSGGCNSYFASYELDGSSLSFGQIGSTLMACAGPAGEVEATYFGNLATVASWASTGGGLLLSDAGGETVLTFQPAEDGMGSGGMGSSAAIEGPIWLLGEQAVDGAMAPLPDGVVVTLVLAAGQAGGSGGCNSYFASYELDGSSITFSEIGSTLMACEGPAGEVESAYFANLAAVATWDSDGTTLTLSDVEGTAILAYSAAPGASIEGDWVATGINSGRGGVVSSVITSEVTATFGADGTLSGSDGCNQYSTTYVVDGNAISIAETIVTTRMACLSDELTEQSAQYFAALLAASTWSVDPSGRLELRDASGALQVSYEPAGS